MPPTRTPADAAAAAYADSLIKRTGGLWLGVWGPYSRCVYAFWCGPAEHGVYVGGANPAELTHQMIAAEAQLQNGQSGDSPALPAQSRQGGVKVAPRPLTGSGATNNTPYTEATR